MIGGMIWYLSQAFIRLDQAQIMKQLGKRAIKDHDWMIGGMTWCMYNHSSDEESESQPTHQLIKKCTKSSVNRNANMTFWRDDLVHANNGSAVRIEAQTLQDGRSRKPSK